RDSQEDSSHETVPAHHLSARRRAAPAAVPREHHAQRPRRECRDQGRGRVGLRRSTLPGGNLDSPARQGCGCAHDRRAVHRRQGACRRLYDHPGAGPRCRAGLGAQARACDHAADRSPAHPRSFPLTGPMADVPLTEIERVFRQEYGRAVAALVRVFGNINDAEEAVQDAFTAAVERWPSTGLPASPVGWIITTARNRAIDRIRRESTREDRHAYADLLQAQDEPEENAAVRDDRLRLIFTCCHPALATPARVALTLRLLGGLTTTAIARAFLVPETTMAQRLVRAKGKIRDAGIPYQ